MLLRKTIFDVRFGNCSTKPLRYGQILQIYWIYKYMQLTKLLDKMSVLDKKKFQNEVQRVLYKLVLVTDSLDHSWRIYSPSNFGIIQKPTHLNFFISTAIT